MPVLVPKGHPLLGKEPPDELPRAAKEFWRSRRLKACDAAVTLGFDKFGTDGFFRFFWFGRQKHIHAHGTWVAPDIRRDGVAFELWATAIEQKKAKKVSVWVTSRGGKKLVAALQAHFPDVAFTVVEP